MINKIIFLVLLIVSVFFQVKISSSTPKTVDIITSSNSISVNDAVEPASYAQVSDAEKSDSVAVTNNKPGVVTPGASNTPPVDNPIETQPKETLEQIYVSQVGVREKTGKNDGPEVEAYLKTTNLGKGNAWCAAFVRWCLLKAGIKNTVTAWSPSAVNSKKIVYKDRKYRQDPKPGDVITFYYPHLGRIGHVGFYHKKFSSTTYQSVEGNTNGAGSREGNGVYFKYRPINTTYIISRWE